ncbi:MAG: PaaI family thioesterase [Pseudomonadota bacterium]
MSNLAESMPFATHLGIEVSEAEASKVVGKMTVESAFCTVGDAVHGGALMAFADSVAAIGAFLNLPEGSQGTTTIESKTNFLGRAVKGTALTAVATPVSVGRRISVWQTMITGDDGKQVALITQSQLVL